jgi:hypothetical protein
MDNNHADETSPMGALLRFLHGLVVLSWALALATWALFLVCDWFTALLGTATMLLMCLGRWDRMGWLR